MNYIADLHIHSHYSIATSKALDPEHLDEWARIKGIRVVGSGDITHPGWLAECREKLEPAGDLYRLKDEYRISSPVAPAQSECNAVFFMLTAEISTIYKRDGKVRKVHHVLFLPDFEAAEKLQTELTKIGNITSDGRPILGLDSRDLLEIALETADSMFFVPAHIWTPWFSTLGDKSGFDSIEACYGPLSRHIYAVETGLSSDPPMNWLCSFLDRYTLISNSDAHSPQKLGRKANLFNTEISYHAMIRALKRIDPDHFQGTVEFFPQEGKYHYDGHRKCQIRWGPEETEQHKGLCPVCGKPVTVGVLNRISQLADRKDNHIRPDRRPFYSMIPLKEILSEILRVGPNSKKVAEMYYGLIRRSGSEFNILLHLPVEEIKSQGGEVLAEAVRRMRKGEVIIESGYDGEFGRIRVFREDEISGWKHIALFTEGRQKSGRKADIQNQKQLSVHSGPNHRVKLSPGAAAKKKTPPPVKVDTTLSEAQEQAVSYGAGPMLVIAGPGTGKTRVITHRIKHLIHSKLAAPETILAVTFTNQAAREMKKRLISLIGIGETVRISTLHALGYGLIIQDSQENGLDQPFIIDEEEKKAVIEQEFGTDRNGGEYADRFSRLKCQAAMTAHLSTETSEDYRRYESFLKKYNLLDFDDLICRPVQMLSRDDKFRNRLQDLTHWILVDEFQDINDVQYRLIQLMAGDRANLCVIGDPRQSIYGFRGADAGIIRRFTEDFPRARIFSLPDSYRCTNRILKAASDVMTEGSVVEGMQRSQISKHQNQSVLTGLTEGVKIHIASHPTGKSEAEFVARTIEQLMGGVRFFSMDSDITRGDEDSEYGLSDFAVLCRIRQLMKPLEKAMNDHGIPCQMVGNEPFFKKQPAALLLDLLKVCCSEQQGFLNQKLDRGGYGETRLFRLKAELKDKNAADALKILAEEAVNTENKKDMQIVTRLLEMAGESGLSSKEFSRMCTLGMTGDGYDVRSDRVTLMTLHASKGLEFSCVFIVGCENGLIPYDQHSVEADPDEERRLLYVGMTRARDRLVLSHARQRLLYGRKTEPKRSPFLDNIEKVLIEQPVPAGRSSRKKDNQLGLF